MRHVFKKFVHCREKKIYNKILFFFIYRKTKILQMVFLYFSISIYILSSSVHNLIIKNFKKHRIHSIINSIIQYWKIYEDYKYRKYNRYNSRKKPLILCFIMTASLISNAHYFFKHLQDRMYETGRRAIGPSNYR